MPDIILSTLNARYIHSAFGLRYLFAHLDELQPRANILEFTINQRPIDIVEQLLAKQPRIIGFGVYIWNVTEITEIAGILKQVAPDICLILGGPEISHETEQQALYNWADYIITGAADLAFAELCRSVLAGARPSNKIMQANFVDPKHLKSPYAYYTETDIANRVIYVEASRGCPFKCEFCLSALDKSAYSFDIQKFLSDMTRLWERGVRRFKFVDRTFNLKIAHSRQILQFFLERLDADTFLHFELIPDHLPDALQALIVQFPAGSLQFEIGIQTFNPDVQQAINRKQDNDKTAQNLRFLAEHSQAHIHADLIIGLPYEDMHSFGRSFDKLYTLHVDEIQVGILKRLRGSPIIRHSDSQIMRYNPVPPYTVLNTATIDFITMQRLGRFARYWDLIGNAGHFRQSLILLLGTSPFARFMCFSDWLYQHSQQTHKIALDKLFDYLHQGMTNVLKIAAEASLNSLVQDFEHSSLRRIPKCLQGRVLTKKLLNKPTAPKRQARHLG